MIVDKPSTINYMSQNTKHYGISNCVGARDSQLNKIALPSKNTYLDKNPQ